MLAPRKATTALVALVALGISGPLSAGEAVPFKLRGTAVVTGFDPVTGTATFDTVGQGTHVGRWVGTATVVSAPGSPSSEGALTVVAADGSIIDIIAEATAIDPTTDAGTYEIVGGTGRFEGATGAGAFVVRANPDGTSSIALDGVIIRQK
jgi:hypothetical protein